MSTPENSKVPEKKNVSSIKYWTRSEYFLKDEEHSKWETRIKGGGVIEEVTEKEGTWTSKVKEVRSFLIQEEIVTTMYRAECKREGITGSNSGRKMSEEGERSIKNEWCALNYNWTILDQLVS